MATKIKIEGSVNANVSKVWNLWVTPGHITKWNNASDDWHTPHATNDLRVGGKFLSRMEAKDGSFGFDFEGVYDEVIEHEKITYTMPDGRKVAITFVQENGSTQVTTVFDAETMNSIEMQEAGWRAIFNNFKKYAESH